LCGGVKAGRLGAERPALTTAGPVADNHASARAALRQGPGYISQVIDAIRRMFRLATVALIRATPATMVRVSLAAAGCSEN
jgi:hypothetical protein